MRIILTLILLQLAMISLPLIAFAEDTTHKYCEAYIRIIEDQVPQEEYLKFDLIITNKQSAPDNVHVLYWIEDSTGRKWSEKREDLFINPLSTRTFKREMFILPGQHAGVYYLKAKIGCGFEELEMEKSFNVILQPVGKTKAAGGEIGLRGVNDELYLINERTEKINVSIANLGETVLHDVFLDITGMPTAWYTIRGERVDELAPGSEATFEVAITPTNVEINAEMTTTFLAHSDEVKEEKIVSVYVFNTTYSAADYLLSRIMERVHDMEGRAYSAGYGSESEVISSLEDIKEDAEKLRASLSRENADEIFSQLVLLSRSLDVVDKTLSSKTEKSSKLLPILQFFHKINVPLYIPVVVLSVIISLVISLIIIRYAGGREIHFRDVRGFVNQHIPRELPKLMHAHSETKPVVTSAQELEEEKKRLEGVLKLIEMQYRQGILSDRAYRELKKRNEEKLKEIDKKLRAAGN